MAVPTIDGNSMIFEELSKIKNRMSEQDKRNDGLEERLAKTTADVYEERQKLNAASTNMVKGKDKLKIVGESGLGVGGLAATITGIFVTAIPGGAIVGIPMIAAGLASTGTGGVLMGGTICKISTRKDIYKAAHDKNVKISYNEAEDLSYGETVNFMNEKFVTQIIKVHGKEIYVDGSYLAKF